MPGILICFVSHLLLPLLYMKMNLISRQAGLDVVSCNAAGSVLNADMPHCRTKMFEVEGLTLNFTACLWIWCDGESTNA